MSGIVAIVGGPEPAIDESMLASMLHLLKQRGPDAQAYWKQDSVALGHTALHTTHESKNEAQPSSLDGRCWLTADARIDGRTGLIAKLRARKRTVSSTATDDHLILHAYSVWGTDCVQHLIGDFAFALWDQDRQRLFCATDHFGVAPMFYAMHGGEFVVSNTLNCVRMHPGVSDTLNDQAVGDYLLFRMNHGAATTTFADVHKLPAGHRLIWERGLLDVSCYWAPGEPEYQRRSAAEHEEEFKELFEAAVHDRLRADAAGTHVSGGMDSTSIAAVLAEAKKNDGSRADIRAYTGIQADESFRLEQPFAQLVADKLGIPIQFHTAGNELLFDSDFDVARALPPEPSFLTTGTTRHSMFQDVRRYGNVLFAGFGGDPLLNSTVHYRGRPGNVGAVLADVPQHWRIHGQYPKHLVPFRRRIKESRRGRAATPALASWVADDFAARFDLRDRLVRITAEATSAQETRQTMAGGGLWRRVFDWHDPGFSGIPVKVRFPFFDVRLVAWSLTVPPRPWFYGKHLLRVIMQDRLPPEILKRPKTPLPGNPRLQRFQESDSIVQLAAVLQEPALAQYVDVSGFLARLDAVGTLTSQDMKAIMRVASLAIWLAGYRNFDAWNNHSHDKQLIEFTRRT